MPIIDYYFSIMSTWAFVGHDAFHAMTRRHGCQIRYVPICLPDLLAESGAPSLAGRSDARRGYRLLELQRWRQKRGLTFDLHPKHFPSDPRLADGLILAALAAGYDPETFIGLAYDARWRRQGDMAAPASILAVADAAGLPGAVLLDKARSEEITQSYARNTRDALAAGVFGSPTYVLQGELFWGQDRIEMLDEALASGRPALNPTAPA
jgi:2-hydroxychromene-2-carboxylate isomerase